MRLISSVTNSRFTPSTDRGPARHRWSFLALLVFLAPTLASAVDPVAGLTVARAGDNLVISWSASLPPVDGYRVYRADDAACASVTLVYEGPLTSYTEVDGFRDLRLALYGVSAYSGSDEGQRTGPVYKYPVNIPPTPPGGFGGLLTSVPLHPGLPDSSRWCEDLNGSPHSATRVLDIVRSRAELGHPQHKFCTTLLFGFELVPSESYILRSSSEDTDTVLVWGVGEEPGTLPLRVPWEERQPCDVGLHFVSLPRDHAYANLAEIAAEIPQAVRVNLFDSNYPGTDCNRAYVGLSRPSPGDPWSGANLPLDHPGEGVVIAVATPSEWTPRRQCTAFTPTANLGPVADAGGPYESTVCRGGLIGIWLNGAGSRDPDNNGPMTYQWTTDCAGTIADPTAEVTPALFDCNPCQSLNCSVTLTVTDFLGAPDSDTEPVFSRQVQTCLEAGNSLKASKSPGGVKLDWFLAPPADNYIVLADDRINLGSPTRLACGSERDLETTAGTPALELFEVEAMNDDCATR